MRRIVCPPLLGVVLLLLLDSSESWERERRQSRLERVRLIAKSLQLAQTLDPSHSLPLTSSSDRSLLPRVFLMPSHPTSGSIMMRKLYEQTTGIAAGCQYREPESPLLFLSVPLEKEWTLYVNDRSSLRPPFGLPTVMKTHFVSALWQSQTHSLYQQGIISGLVLLVRNPGDVILHNLLRWSACPTGVSRQQRAGCYAEKLETVCRRAVMHASEWADFYSSWLTLAASTHMPLFLLKYEELLTEPTLTLTRLYHFMGVPHWTPPQPVASSEEVARAGRELGVCTLPQIQQFVSRVRNVSEQVGYSWSETEQRFVWT